MTKHRNGDKQIGAMWAAIQKLERGQEQIMTLTTDLQAQIDRVTADATALKTEVDTAVADIATLKGGMKVGDPITQAQIDAVAKVGDNLEGATAALKAGE